jgi:serine/threonine protein kinase/tetratricopeptide (TPR) repeat protein
MNEPSHNEEEIFEAALKLPPEQRAAYLQTACGGDAAHARVVRARVLGLLAAHDQAGGFMEEPAAPRKTIVLSFPPEEKTGDKIGHYKLLQQIGEGGCGIVYMAEQEEPVRRRVALKVIKLGMDTKSVIARFEAERQALAMMDHPNIAKVLDAGATENGRPFFVMELVRGIKITDYCDQNKLSTDERLNLFVQVCNAIQHAHQKGIIHRDIKPSNILVTLHDGKPVPKVIDFGIAKATQGRLTDQTLFTAFEQFIGTPAYMSPEQAEMSGLDIDTRSDIYALGVLLYELLTGRTPFDPKELLQSGLDELRRTIREKEPAKPSTKLGTLVAADLTDVAQRRQSDAPKLIHSLRGDLDWIVMKSLEKDRTRRYETANGMAMDIQRYLTNEPIVARPPSTVYKFQKLVRRNKALFTAIGVGMAALILGLILSLYLFVQERLAYKREVAAEQVEEQLKEAAQRDVAVGQQIFRAELLMMQGEYAESETIIAPMHPHATLVPFYNVFGTVHARHHEWPEALTNWEMVVTWAPEDPIGYERLAPLLLQSGNTDGYEALRAQILKQFGNTSDPGAAERMVKTALILPASDDDMKIIAQMAGVAATGNTNDDKWGYKLFAMGFSEYRLGHYTNALELMRQADPLDIGPFYRTEVHLVMAMARAKLNRADDAKDSFAKAVDDIKTKLVAEGGLDSDDWYNWLAIQVLVREAATVVYGTDMPAAADSPQTPDWQTALTKAGFKFTSEKHDDGTWEVALNDQPFNDLAMLKDARISELSLMRTKVSDLTPLQAMPLQSLHLAGTPVTDLSPLHGMSLTLLQISGTAVSNLAPIQGMPLRTLNMTDCTNITDLSPLANMTTLQAVILPPNATNFTFLRNFPELRRISFKYDPAVKGAAQTAAEFWAEQDKNKAATSAQ